MRKSCSEDATVPPSGLVCEACGNDADLNGFNRGASPTLAKPQVDRWEDTSHKSSRNGADIDHIVIHYTTSRNIDGTIITSNTALGNSAHYIVGLDGALVQMVEDAERACMPEKAR